MDEGWRGACQVLFVEEFRRASVDLVFVGRAIAGAVQEDLLLYVQGTIAEYERTRTR